MKWKPDLSHFLTKINRENNIKMKNRLKIISASPFYSANKLQTTWRGKQDRKV